MNKVGGGGRGRGSGMKGLPGAVTKYVILQKPGQGTTGTSGTPNGQQILTALKTSQGMTSMTSMPKVI